MQLAELKPIQNATATRAVINMAIRVWSTADCVTGILSIFSLSFVLLNWTTPGAAQMSLPPSTIPAYSNILVRPPIAVSENDAKRVEVQPASQPGPNAAVSNAPLQATLAMQQLACTPPSASNEVVELARALKWNPDLIYEYVRNNIKTIPIYDSLKGPLGTLLDGAGTPVDQAELTFVLLQQSCFSPQYQVGMIFLTAAQLDKWLGTTTTIDTNQTNSLGAILAKNGFCTSITFSPTAPPFCNGTTPYTLNGVVTGADVPWIWVSVPISGTTYQFDPASKILPNNGGDGYLPYSSGLGTSLATTALQYDQLAFLNGARSGASGIGTAALGFSQAGRNNVRNSLTQYANNLVGYIRGLNSLNSPVTTTDIVGGSTIQPLPAYAPPASGNTLWGQTSLSYLNHQGISPTATGSLAAFRTTLTLTLGWNDANDTFTQLANPVAFNSADIYTRRLVIQFNATNVASLLLDGIAQATASSAGPSTFQLTARAAIFHPHMPCSSLPIPSVCTGGPGPNIDNVRVTPETGGGSIFVVGTGWGRSNRGPIERHRKLLQQNLMQGQSATSEAVLGESLAMIGSTWLASYTRAQLVTGELSGTTVTYLHAVGIIGMKPVGVSKGPFVDLPLNTVGATQRVSRPAGVGFTPSESSVLFTVATISSILESGTIEQTQPKDMNGQPAVASSTIKLLDIWSTSGTIYTLNDPAVSGDNCAFYKSNLKNSLVNFVPADKKRVESLIGYTASTDSCSATASTTQVIVPSHGDIAVGQQWTGTGYLQLLYDQNQTNVVGIGAIITGGLSGGEPASPVPAPVVNQNQAFGAVQAPISGCDDCNIGSPSQIGNGNASSLGGNIAVASGGSSAAQPAGGDPVNLVTGAYTYTHQDIAVGSGSYPYALPFIRSYDSASAGAGANSSALGKGWMHNYDMTAFSDSDVFEAMGENSPISGAAGIAAIYVIQDILNLKTSNAKPADRVIIAAQIERWLSDQSIGNIVAVTQPGSVERFTLLPNSGGSNVYVPPLGSSSQLTALAGGGYSYRLKTGETLTFNPATAVASGRVTSWNSPSGASVVFSYNSDGKLQSIASPATQRQLNLHYTNQQLTSVDDNTGRTVSYSYDAGANLITATDPLHQATVLNYGVAGQLTQIFYPTNPGNPFVTTVYDSLGRASRQFDAVGNTSSLFFAGSRSEIDDTAGTASVSYFSQRGKTVASIAALGSSGINNGAGIKMTNQYDGLDRLKTTVFPEGGAVTYSYATAPNPWANNISTVVQSPKLGFPDTTSTTFTFDSIYNKPTSVTDTLGLVNTANYDSTTGNLRSAVADAGGAPHFNATSRLTYNAIGQVLTAADPLGIVTQFGYDGFGNLTSIVRDAGFGRLNQLTVFGYNAQGDVISITDPKGNVTTNIYDATRRLTTTTAPNGLVTAYTYDPNGQVTQVQQSIKGAVLRTTSATYTLTGKPATATDANGNITRYSYDVLDRVSSVKDAVGRTTSYGYDALSRQISISNPAIQSAPLLLRSYTLDGLLAGLTDANNHTTSFAYDGIDRLVTTTYPLGSTETLTYDADNNVLSRKTRANQAISFSYDTLNRLKTKTPPSPTPVVSYAYDLAGRLTGVSDTSAAVVAAVPPTSPSVQYATTAAYDALNRPTGISWNPAPAAAAPTAGSVTFGHSYNKANQRVGQTVSDNTWLNYPAAASPVSYITDALNRYTAVGAVSPTYDGNSNLTSDGTFTLGYDAENRLTTASGAGNTASYTYDAQGRRKTKTVNGATTVFVTDAGNREVLEYDGATGAIQRWYAYALGSNDVLNQTNVAAGMRTGFIPDIQGSVIGSIDSSSGALSKIGYLLYGKSAGVAAPFGYTAQRIDPEIGGSYYYRARNYSPAWGRFWQTDPIGYGGGVNLYAYVGNDPLNNSDPSGTCPQCLAGAAVGAVVGLGIQASIDIWNGQLSSFNQYAGAVVGGAAGGAAATVCGPACAGAAAGAASNLVTNGLNGSFSASGLAVDTAIGAAGGAVLGQVVPYTFKNYVSNGVKGTIGEGLTQLDLALNGQTIVQRNAANGVGRSTFDFLLGDGSFVESKFGTSGLSTVQRRAAAQQGDNLRVDYWDYPTVSGLGAAGAGAGAAGSGK